jgi:hypothetical protein
MFGLDFGLIALVLVIAREVLTYVAPRTKTKGDDKALAGVKKAQELLPAIIPAATATAPRERMPAPAPTRPAPTTIKGFDGSVVRDHRD